MDNNNNLFYQFSFGCYILENIQAKLSKRAYILLFKLSLNISVQQQDIKFVDVRLTSVDCGPLNLGHGIVRCSAIDCEMNNEQMRAILHIFFYLFCL